MNTNYTTQDRGDKKSYSQYLEAMDAISVEKVASASAFFEPVAGNTIVDVGMASGTSTAILSQLFPQLQIIGVDINPRMVEIARNGYNFPNLSFREDDGEKLTTFAEQSVNGFFNCSSIHHITSYNNYDNNRAFNTLRRQAELLKNNGVLVVRDFVRPKEQEVILELSTDQRPERPDDAALILIFAKTARSLAAGEERGFPIEELVPVKKNTRRFRLFYTDAVEFIRRKDYYSDWEVELQEEYGYFSQYEFENIFRELGLRIIISAPVYNPWIINNRYKGQFQLYDSSGHAMAFPPTNYLIAGEKVSGGKEIRLIRHLPEPEIPFLQSSWYRNAETGEIYDVIERPNPVSDIIPYYREGDKISVLAKRGYPRPLANIGTGSLSLDSKYYSGYIPECISVGDIEDTEKTLAERFGIDRDNYDNIYDSLEYYTSPGGINEKVTSKYVGLLNRNRISETLKDGFSSFKESGSIHSYDAAQLLNTAQTGALVEARLEMNIYHLFFKLGIGLPKWLGEKIVAIPEQDVCPVKIEELLSLEREDYVRTDEKSRFLTKKRACFSEMDRTGSSAVLEYMYPSKMSTNTLTTLPIVKNKGKIYVGLELRSLPVPQIQSGNSLIVTVPAKRLPMDVADLYGLQSYIQEMKTGDSRIVQFFKLGEKYFPSVGVTPEQVYPYVVFPDKPDNSLKWVDMADLYAHIGQIQNAHLLICLCRLIHALDYNTLL